MDAAFRRAGIPHQTITAEMLAIAKQDMSLMFAEWSNRGYQMWTIERTLLAYTYAMSYITLPTGAIDVDFACHRTVSVYTGSAATSTSAYTLDLGSGVTGTVTSVKIQPTNAGSYTFAVEGSNDNVTWTTLLSNSAVTYTAAENKWYIVEAGGLYRYFRVRETTGASVTFTDVDFCYNPSDIQLAVINEDVYATLPNKTFTSQVPIQYWFNRQVSAPRLFLWPRPTDTTSCLYVVYRRHIQDVGTFLQSPEVPQAWWNAVVNGLAVYLILDIKEADSQRLPTIQQMAEQSLNLALQDCDPGPFTVNVDISVYTS